MKIINTNHKIHNIFFSILFFLIYLSKTFIIYLYTSLNSNFLILIINSDYLYFNILRNDKCISLYVITGKKVQFKWIKLSCGC